MMTGLCVSLREYIRNHTDYFVQIQYDGIEFPDEDSFIFIKPAPTDIRNISKRKELVNATYLIELVVYSDSLTNRNAIQQELFNLVHFGDIPLFNDSGENTGRKIDANVLSVVPVYPEEIIDKSKHNQTRLVVEIQLSANFMRRNK